MNIKTAYQKQVEFAGNCNVRNGSTSEQSRQAGDWCLRIAGLAAFLGFDHEIIIDDCSDEYDAVMAELEKNTPNRFWFDEYRDAYVSAVCVVEDGRVPFYMAGAE